MHSWKLTLCAAVSLVLALATNARTPAIAHASTEDLIKQYIYLSALWYNVDPTVATYIVEHESHFCRDQHGDDGNSRGCWQISKIWHPEVSDACAFDLECSTKWSLSWIKSGHARQWTTYRQMRK